MSLNGIGGYMERVSRWDSLSSEERRELIREAYGPRMGTSALRGFFAALVLALVALTLAGCGVLGGIRQSIPPPTRGAYALTLECDGETDRYLLTARAPITVAIVCGRLDLRLEALEKSSRDDQHVTVSCDDDPITVTLSPGVSAPLGAMECAELTINLEED